MEKEFDFSAPKNIYSDEDTVVTLDISGVKKIKTRVRYLLKSSYFRKIFGLNGEKTQKQMEDGSFFIDCHPSAFEVILEYLRTGEYCLRSSMEKFPRRFLISYFNMFGVQVPVKLQQKRIKKRTLKRNTNNIDDDIERKIVPDSNLFTFPNPFMNTGNNFRTATPTPFPFNPTPFKPNDIIPNGTAQFFIPGQKQL